MSCSISLKQHDYIISGSSQQQQEAKMVDKIIETHNNQDLKATELTLGLPGSSSNSTERNTTIIKNLLVSKGAKRGFFDTINDSSKTWAFSQVVSSSPKHSLHDKLPQDSTTASKLCVTDINVVAKPIYDVDGISGEGSRKKNHCKAFYFYGNTYELEDTVLLAADPQGRKVKPYVAIIKEINETGNGRLMLTVQWFYRPEDVKIKHGKNLESSSSIGARELFYTFHKDKVVPESVIHKCTVHFVPEHKQIPCRKQHPGFIVQKLYNPNTKRLLKLNDKAYIDCMKLEIEQLVNKTICRLGVLPDIKTKDDDPSDEEVMSD